MTKPTRHRRSWTTPDGCGAILTGHEDIIVEILARLPVKSLFRFRCVCTTWRTLISAPYFVTKHIKHDNARALNDNDVRVVFSMNPPTSIGLADLKDMELPDFVFPIRKLEFPILLDGSNPNVGLVGSCNGIICAHFGSEFVLWNPCTGEHNVVPKPKAYARYYGFGYDHVCDDYKVVMGYCNVCEGSDEIEPIVHVFSLRRGAWNMYLGPRKSHMRRMGACVNGVLHWLRFGELPYEIRSDVVLSFSLVEEKFLDAMPLPSKFRAITVFGDCLCVYNGKVDVRIMMIKNDGFGESWTEVLYRTSRTDTLDLVKPLWILENGDVLAWRMQQLGQGSGILSVYKSKDKTFEDVFNIEGSYNYEQVTYRETLVSPVTGHIKGFC